MSFKLYTVLGSMIKCVVILHQHISSQMQIIPLDVYLLPQVDCHDITVLVESNHYFTQ
jgi:hypothetical protein